MLVRSEKRDLNRKGRNGRKGENEWATFGRFGMGSYGPEETTTKHAKDAKMGERIVFKEESYRIIGACFVEIKAVRQLADEYRAQVINYLKSTGKQLGLLVKFGCHPKIEYERFVDQSL